jgi:hypothetical protein
MYVLLSITEIPSICVLTLDYNESPMKVNRRFTRIFLFNLQSLRYAKQEISSKQSYELYSSLACSSALMEAIYFSETLVEFNRITLPCTPEDTSVHAGFFYSSQR